MFRIKASTIIAHCIAWIIFISLPLLFLSNRPEGIDFLQVLFSWKYVVFICSYSFIFYLNYYVLVPDFYLQKKFFGYFGILLALLLFIGYIKPFDNLLKAGNRQPFQAMQNPSPGFPPQRQPKNFPQGPPPNNNNLPARPRNIDAISIFLFIMVTGVSTAVCISDRWRDIEKRATIAEAEKTSAELSFLKAQINPHFLFNTLNNIYSLAVTKSDNTADCIMKLSNIMRYVTDDVSEDFVPLQSEINCINDYIGLQKLRLADKVNIDLQIAGDTEGKRIAPLLLMTFVENIFKYGISKREPSDIIIKVATDNMSINFFSRNKIFPAAVTEQRTGVGIANATKRLEYLYTKKHLLNINTDDGLYTVQLTLQI
jgi:two-component system, LytTR family, sensor kinase